MGAKAKRLRARLRMRDYEVQAAARAVEREKARRKAAERRLSLVISEFPWLTHWLRVERDATKPDEYFAMVRMSGTSMRTMGASFGFACVIADKLHGAMSNIHAKGGAA